MKYKVFYYSGNELTLKTTVLKGYAKLDDSGLHVEGLKDFVIPINELQTAKLFRLHGLGRVIQIDHISGRLFISVVRLMIGQFALINFFKTGRLYKQLSTLTNGRG
jgi:hypothetical protein